MPSDIIGVSRAERFKITVLITDLVTTHGAHVVVLSVVQINCEELVLHHLLASLMWVARRCQRDVLCQWCTMRGLVVFIRQQLPSQCIVLGKSSALLPITSPYATCP